MSTSNDDVEECFDEESKEDDVGVNRTEFSCDSQQVYENSGNQKKVLFFLLCLRLCLSETDDSPLFSFENEPWSRLLKTEMRPVNVDFAKEIVRQARLLCIHPTPQPLNWPRAQKLEWLETNPVEDSIDISFLRGEVSRIKGILERSLEEERQQLEVVGLGGIGVSSGRGNWRGSVPYLRLILCLTQDDIKFAFLRRADAQSRQELDARNSENR
jgi:hypothetical protein